jgi:hypothetical protein
MITIYALVCQPNRKAYIGSTKGNLGKRMREHRCLLKAGRHAVKALQADWRLYGERAFAIEAIHELPFTTLAMRRAMEVFWMDWYAEHRGLYNEHRISMEPLESARIKGAANAHLKPGNRWIPEANEKRRQAQLGIPKGHGAKISATKRARREMR